MTALWVALAGGAGAVARFGLDSAVTARLGSRWPWGTFVINVSGSLLLGVLTGLLIAHSAPAELRLVAGTGFCGGYTTFSTATMETVRLVAGQRRFPAVAYSAGSLLAAALAAGLGLLVTGA